MDTETKIQHELASKLPQEAPRDYSYPQPELGESTIQPESGLAPTPESDPIRDLHLKYQVLEHFALSPNSPAAQQYGEAITSILEYAKKEAAGTETADILRVLNDVERQLGITLHANKINRFKQFVVIRNQRRLLEEKERALYG